MNDHLYRALFLVFALLALMGAALWLAGAIRAWLDRRFIPAARVFECKPGCFMTREDVQ